ncbi:hypothetical protein, partial [Burkholderia cenocepacia]|uniref:hypothetical protein n=1 Tax=Burkholderia cenocepacia TaxID=95486 RepID=UPI0022382BF9
MSTRGIKAFDAYYGNVFGQRWPELKEALQAPVSQVARLNKFADQNSLLVKFPEAKRDNFRGIEWV